jgi:hypothetical protein
MEQEHCVAGCGRRARLTFLWAGWTNFPLIINWNEWGQLQIILLASRIEYIIDHCFLKGEVSLFKRPRTCSKLILCSLSLISLSLSHFFVLSTEILSYSGSLPSLMSEIFLFLVVF